MMRSWLMLAVGGLVACGGPAVSKPADPDTGEDSMVRLERVASYNVEGSDLAVASDARTWAAHRRGRVRIWRGDGLLAEHDVGGADPQVIRFAGPTTLLVGPRRLEWSTGAVDEPADNSLMPALLRGGVVLGDGRTVAVLEHRPRRGRRGPGESPSGGERGASLAVIGADGARIVLADGVPPSARVFAEADGPILVGGTDLVAYDRASLQPSRIAQSTYQLSDIDAASGWVVAIDARGRLIGRSPSRDAWSLEAHQGRGRVALRVADEHLATGGADGRLRIWQLADPPTPLVEARLAEGLRVAGLAWLDGRTLLVATEGRASTVDVWALQGLPRTDAKSRPPASSN